MVKDSASSSLRGPRRRVTSAKFSMGRGVYRPRRVQGGLVLLCEVAQEAAMNRKLYLQTAAQREARQLLIDAAPLVADYAGVGEVAVELKFVDPEGKHRPS